MNTTGKTHVALALAALLALAGGCRREDIREFTVEIPGLTESNKAAVVGAFTVAKPGQAPHVCDGVYLDSFVFDFAKKTLTLRYDSMKIAKTNIRMLIQDKGIEVAFPTNGTGVAGYVDRKVE